MAYVFSVAFVSFGVQVVIWDGDWLAAGVFCAASAMALIARSLEKA